MTIANHQAWLDSLILICNVFPGFAAAIETSKVPVLNVLIDCLQSLYISRGGTE
jgi:1-acyl-sn-glycerol-3-phosphate acyltransferase